MDQKYHDELIPLVVKEQLDCIPRWLLIRE